MDEYIKAFQEQVSFEIATASLVSCQCMVSILESQFYYLVNSDLVVLILLLVRINSSS